MFKKLNIEMKKVRTKKRTITSKLATGTQPYDYTNRYSTYNFQIRLDTGK